MAGLNNDSLGLYSGSPGLNEGTLGLYSGSPGLIHEGGGGGGGGATADAQLVWNEPAKSGFVYWIRMF